MQPEVLQPDWEKIGGLLPAVVQDADSGEVLMLAYMNAAALKRSQASGRVTFYSRSRQQLWTKGETSGHTLELVDLRLDCDRDALLVIARPAGPVCHTGTQTCFGDDCAIPTSFLGRLQRLVVQRHEQRPPGSYTTSLFDAGPRRMAQKLGEEGVETALAGAGGDDEELIDESADLLFHLLVLLTGRDLSLDDVARRLAERHAASSTAKRTQKAGKTKQ